VRIEKNILEIDGHAVSKISRAIKLGQNFVCFTILSVNLPSLP